ncbi:hypothetical protein BJV82DRAFT_665120 [Fennellomyces sp. T-0311]|nr:hypothetical protein BJV82DRAFT_665120 [Fennellomyces sp. T-0311]
MIQEPVKDARTTFLCKRLYKKWFTKEMQSDHISLNGRNANIQAHAKAREQASKTGSLRMTSYGTDVGGGDSPISGPSEQSEAMDVDAGGPKQPSLQRVANLSAHNKATPQGINFATLSARTWATVPEGKSDKRMFKPDHIIRMGKI